MACDDQLPSIHVAIVGGGITGLTLGIALQQRNIPFTIYERSSGFREIGAGIGFSPNAEEAMKRLAPAIHTSYKQVITPNGEDYFQWVSGETNELMYKLYMGVDGFQGGLRSDILDAWSKLIDLSRVQFNKQLETIEEPSEGSITLTFRDGATAKADVVIGADGIRSRTRTLLHPDATTAATYTHKYCFRAVVPMSRARPVLGEARTCTRFMYNGPDAHIITYPVARGEQLNVLLVISDEEAWAGAPDGRHTSTGTKDEAERAFARWHPHARAIVSLLPETGLDKWAIFDHLENGAGSYVSASGRVCVAGDAAHACGPHLGAGAGFGMEDGLVLVTGLEEVAARLKSGRQPKEASLRAVLKAYEAVRRERTRWLIQATRDAVALFEWQYPECGDDPVMFGKEITWRFHKIWNVDMNRMTEETREKIRENLGSGASA